MVDAKKKTLLHHLHQLKALDNEIRSAINHQQRDGRLSEQQDVARLVDQVESVMAHQSERLEKRIDALGGSSLTGEMKERIGQALGLVDGLWQGLWDKPLSSALRDHYAALNVMAAHYSMLHAAARALGDTTTADMAYQHLKEVTPLVVETSQVMPLVVVGEIAAKHEGVDLTQAIEAVQATHQAWQPEHTEQPATHAAG